MKILLMKVPEIDFEERQMNYSEVLSCGCPPIPLGVAALSAYLKKHTSHEVIISDPFLDCYPMPNLDMGRQAMFSNIQKTIEDVKPDVLGISALMIINHKWVHHIAKVAKQVDPNIKVIVGGGYATLMSKKVLADENIDCIVKGEGEEKLLNLLSGGELPVSFLYDHYIEDVDSLPYYDWQGIRLERYMANHPNRFASYVTSRGCPFGCAFCSTHLMWGSKFRGYSAGRVLEEIDYLVTKYNVEEVEFSDDNLTFNRRRILEILHGFIDRGYRFSWTHPNAVSVVTLDGEVLETMRRSGCNILTIAPESGCDRVLKQIIHKPASKDKIREVVKMAKGMGFKIQGAWIVGFPGETREEIDETRDFILELELDRNQISIATPFIGTEMYKTCEEKGYLVHTDDECDRYRYGFANIRTQDWDEKWLKQKAYDINIEVNFLKNPVIENDPAYAVAMFEDILSRYPKHLVASVCLANAYMKLGEQGKATSIFADAFNLAQREPEIYNIYKKYMEAA